MGLDNNPISRYWYEQDSIKHQLIQFRDVSYFEPDEWLWTFGDGNSAEQRHPLHHYDENGTYEVCLIVSNENNSHTSCQELQIGPVANQNLKLEYNISIFPNPVEDYTRLVFHDYLPEKAVIELYNANGGKLFTARIYQESMIDLSILSAGVYMYQIQDGRSVLDSGKLVKI